MNNEVNKNLQLEREYFSPGRVNLIGEYTDIAGGNVLPMAISQGIKAVVTSRTDRRIEVSSFGDTQSFSLDNLEHEKVQWINYIIGVFKAFYDHNYVLKNGLNIVLTSTLPEASGLSSSACLEVLMGTIINEEYDLGVKTLDIVLFAKEAENKFIGVNCGIMDQFACAFGKKNNAILINTKTNEYQYVPFNLGDYDLVILNTNKKRTLADSKYNERVTEVNKALEVLKSYVSFDDACSIKVEDFNKYKVHIDDNKCYRRLHHVIFENQRVILSNNLLKQGNIHDFCEQLIMSHHSLKYDFEVTGKELDTLVDLAMENGALGARMTGAGFGGCAIMVCKKSETDKIIKKMSSEYKKIIGYDASFYIAEANDGARRIK